MFWDILKCFICPYGICLMAWMDKEFSVENNSSEEWMHGPLHFSFQRCFWEVHSHSESLSFAVTCFSSLEASRIFILPSELTNYSDMSLIMGLFSSTMLSLPWPFQYVNSRLLLLWIFLVFFYRCFLSSLFSLFEVSTVQIFKLLDHSFNFIFSPIHYLYLLDFLSNVFNCIF